MKWYDLFSRFYDRSLEHLYEPYRKQLVEEVGDIRGAQVVDLACGTGQNWDVLVAAIGDEGHIVGIDGSSGMLARANERIERNGWSNVSTLCSDVAAVDAETLRPHVPRVDLLVCTLGFTAFPDWESRWADALSWVRPGGKVAILDVAARTRTWHTTSVEMVARADLSRRVDEAVTRDCSDTRVIWLDASPKTFGGDLFIATGRVPGPRAQ